MSQKAEEIFQIVFQSYENNEEFAKLKMPENSKIHEFNMAIKELCELGYIEVLEKNMVFAKLIATESGLEKWFENN